MEAQKESHVKDAIRGLRTVFAGKGARLVPINEMVDAVTVNKKAKDALGKDGHGYLYAYVRLSCVLQPRL